ncbi:unnamed protein product, partial [Chrysoparadoxa australica]
MKKLEPGMAYDTQKLNKVFAFLSIIFLMTTVWVFLDDYIRPWKAVQVEAIKIKKQKLQEKLDAAEKEINKDKLAALEKQLKDSEEIVSKRKMDIVAVDKKITKNGKLLKAETINNGILNSKVSAFTFKYEQAQLHHGNNQAVLFANLKDFKKQFAESKDRMKAYQAEEKKLRKEKQDLQKEVLETEKQIKEITGQKELIGKALDKTKMGPIFALRNAPLIDYLDPTLKIEQIVLENITDDRYFQQVPRVDRCITCHTFIDQAGYEDQPNPHKTHPKLDLMVGIDSPHPMKKTGCTTCHGGEGHRVNDFTSVAHWPENKEQRKEWEEKYNWHEPHRIPSPMLKLSQTEASCVKCHQGVEFIPGATVLNEGRQNMEKFGCYGCHKIEGWEHK